MSQHPLLDRLVESYSRQNVGFESLRPFHVRDILLVASLYDSYSLAEDGRLAEQIFGEFHTISSTAPAYLTRVATAEQALELLRTRRYDLVITMARVGDISVQEFGEQVKRMHPGLPIYLLTYDTRELGVLEANQKLRGIDKVFVWRGDVRLFLAVIRLTEDRLNVEHDTTVGQVRVLILVEDSVPFYSSYLPMLFDEIMKQTSALIHESANITQKLLRMRARPKILLATNYEEAWELYRNFEEVVLGVISDVRFPRGGKLDPEAGVELIRSIREEDPYVPLVLQSSEDRARETARFLGATFLNKRSPTLLKDFRRFMLDNLGFGDFVFRLPDGTEVGRASDIRTMVEVLDTAPKESLQFHGRLNHFSNWLMARTEFGAASVVRLRQVSDFESVEEMRSFLQQTLVTHRQRTRRGLVEDFDPNRFDAGSEFVRIGGGSLGGKGRGLAFTHELLSRYEIEDHFPDTRVFVPPSAVLGTEVFDDFLEDNGLLEFALREQDDRTILRRFLGAHLPKGVVSDLAAFLDSVRYPVAVRSSSLLEDSQYQPFAGIYNTQMLPNCHPDREVRLQQLLDAVKFIFASTFFQAAKAYLGTTPHRMEEEKMAVVIQQIVGKRCGDYVYPHVSGVANSLNFYPVGHMKPEEGICSVALGLGKTVVEGGRTVRFSPAHPESLPQFSVTDDILENAQRRFWALDASRPLDFFDPDSNLVQLDLTDAERHGMLWPVGSTYLPENDTVVDGISRPGVRLVTFAPLLKGQLGPFSEILQLLLELGFRGLSGPAEIEFALNLDPDHGGRKEFAFLQIRPNAAVDTGRGAVDLEYQEEDVLARSASAMGNGRLADIRDILFVRPEVFARESTIDIATEVGKMNDALTREGRRYLLIGPGRWGTSDRWLGIPVAWAQIAGAQAIIETDLSDVPVDPSQGTHFFQNMTSYGIAYLHVHRRTGGFLDDAWLERQKPFRDGKWVRHLRFDDPLEVLIDGKLREGVILKKLWHSSSEDGE
ncbi:histidine kinase [bacterium]|nr:histidine kinase [bacterium]